MTKSTAPKRTVTVDIHGKEYEIPSMAYLPFGIIIDIEDMPKTTTDMEKLIYILKELLGTDSKEYKAVRSLYADEIDGFIKTWTGQEDTETPLGE